MLIDSHGESRSNGPLLFLFESNFFRAYSPEHQGEVTPEEIVILNNPSRIFNLIAESNGSNVRSVFIAAPSTLARLATVQESMKPGDFVAFQQGDDYENDHEIERLQLESVATSIRSAKVVQLILLTNNITLLSAKENRYDQRGFSSSKSFNDTIRLEAKKYEALLCDVEHFFTNTNRDLALWGTSLVQSDGITPNIFGNICLAVLLYRTVVQNANPDMTALGQLLERSWFHLRGSNNLPLHFRSDKLLPILAQSGAVISSPRHIDDVANNCLKRSSRGLQGRPLTGATQRIQCVPMSRNGVHLLMGILAHLGAFCYFGKLELHYERHDGRLCLNDVGRKFVTTFATDMSLYDDRIETEIPLWGEFSHRLTDSLFREKWIRCVRDPRDMLVSIHDLAPVKKLGTDTVSIAETLEVPLPNAGGCLFGFGPIEEWALQQSFLHHVLKDDQLCYVGFERIKSDGVNEISRLLDFLGFDVNQRDIEDALLANKAETVRPYGRLSQSGGKIGHWQSRDFASLLDQRYSLLAQVLRNPHNYPFQIISPKSISWPSNVFVKARDGWVTKTLHNLKKQFPSSRYELFRESLLNFTQLAADLPLLEIQLAEVLLADKNHVRHAKDILKMWTDSPLWSPRFMALMSLAKYDRDFNRRLKLSLVEAQSVWQQTKHPLIRQMALRLGFFDENVLSFYDNPTQALNELQLPLNALRSWIKQVKLKVT